MNYTDYMRKVHAKQAEIGDHSHDEALNAALDAVNELIDQESGEDEGDQDLEPLRTARQSLLQFQKLEYAENEDGEDTNAKLAKLRSTLKDARLADRKAVQVARANDGTFHTNVASHDRLANHLTGPSHGMAILPSWRGSTKNMAVAHEAAHVNRPQDHGVGEVGDE